MGHHIFETFDADKNSDLDLDEFITLYEEYFLCVIYLFIFIFYVQLIPVPTWLFSTQDKFSL